MMNDSNKTPARTTDGCDLEHLIMDSNIPKSESGWWAKHRIEELEAKLALAVEALEFYTKVDSNYYAVEALTKIKGETK